MKAVFKNNKTIEYNGVSTDIVWTPKVVNEFGSFQHESGFKFNGVEYGPFKTQRECKEKFAELVDANDVMMRIVREVEEHESSLGRDVLGNNIEDIFGIKELKNR
jgi:hypothetical protein